MAKLSKRQQALTAVDREKFYGVDEAISLVKGNATAKFDETVEVALNLGVDPRQLFVAELDVHRAAFTSSEPNLRSASLVVCAGASSRWAWSG